MIRHLLPIASLMTSTFLLLAGMGLASVLIPLRAAEEGWGPVLIGWMGASYSAMFMAGCIIVPRMVLRVGHVRVFSVVASILCISLLMHALIIDAYAWIILRGITGFSLAGAYMLVESWLNEQSTNETRGKVFAIYMLANMLGMMAGQFILTGGDASGLTLFIIAALLFASAIIPTGLSNATSPKPLTQASLDLKKLYRNSPVAFAGAFAGGIVLSAWAFQGPVYLGQIGFDNDSVALMMMLVMIGGALSQFPVGWLSDRFDRRLVMAGCAFLAFAVSLVLMSIPSAGSVVIYAMLGLFGVVVMPIYSVIVAHANDHADPGDFVEISSGLLIIYGVGSMLGPVVSGFLMENVGPTYLFLVQIVTFVAFGIYTLIRIRIRDAVPEEERTDFAVTPLGRSQTPEIYQFSPQIPEE